MSRVTAVCIKSYLNEDDVEEYEAGNISKEDIHEYKVGDYDTVITPGYDKEYWKVIEGDDNE